MRILPLIFLFLSLDGISQEKIVWGDWRTETFYDVIHFNFKDAEKIERTTHSSLNTFAFEGHYSQKKDTIIIEYYPIPLEKSKLYHFNPDVVISNDTLILINANKIKVNNSYFIYNKSRKEYEFKIDSNTNALTYKVDSFDDSFVLKQYQFNRWIVVDTFVTNKEIFELKNYVLPTHSGLNKFRIDLDQKTVKTFEIKSKKKKVKLGSKKMKDKLVFSAETYFEIYDQDGFMIIRGSGNSCNVSQLKKGLYYLNFDNHYEKVLKE